MKLRHRDFKAFVPLRVRDTGLYGKGTFAIEPVRVGTVIAKFGGERLTFGECDVRVAQGVIRPDDPLQIGPREYLHLDEPSRLFNHCCEPNAALIRTCDLVAIRDISAGEEICYDYSATVPPSVRIVDWTMPCQCGAPGCRGLIGSVMTLPPERIARLLSGEGQSYMRRELEQVWATLHKVACPP